MAKTYPSKKKYERETVLKVTVGFNRNTEPELVAWMERKGNKAGYLKRLALEDAERERAEGGE